MKQCLRTGLLTHLPGLAATLLMCIGVGSATAGSPEADGLQDDGMMGSEYPRIPEPMVFDLVRPLGSTRGELEVNTLAQHRGDGVLEWAPEIEFTIADGLAVELELPVENSTREATKVAVQGTFRRGRTEHFIHGWQAIGAERRDDGRRSFDGIYIAGYQFGALWSTLVMGGLRLDQTGRHTSGTVLLNASAFYSLGDHSTLGLEYNGRLERHGRFSSYVPQLHHRLSDHWSLQTGLDFNRRRGSGAGSSHRVALSLRLIHTF